MQSWRRSASESRLKQLTINRWVESPVHTDGGTESAAYGVVTLAACTPAQTTSHDIASAPVATAAPTPSTSPVQNVGDFVKSAVQIELRRYALGVGGLKRAHARELRALANPPMHLLRIGGLSLLPKNTAYTFRVTLSFERRISTRDWLG